MRVHLPVLRDIASERPCPFEVTNALRVFEHGTPVEFERQAMSELQKSRKNIPASQGQVVLRRRLNALTQNGMG